jgi:hypothetical protein
MSNRLRARMANALRHRLHYASAKHPLAEIIPDANWPGMWRVRWPDGSLSDLTNLSRARDAAIAIAERGPPARNRCLLSWRTAYVEEALGASFAELKELERAIEAAESAVEAGRDEVRLEAGVFDPHKFDQLAAPVEAKANAPWLKKFRENGEDVVRKIEIPEGQKFGSAPLATPEEIANGIFADDGGDLPQANRTRGIRVGPSKFQY